jgi:hypothetical protein
MISPMLSRVNVTKRELANSRSLGNHFPTPAWLYYGYPHSGDGSLSPGF